VLISEYITGVYYLRTCFGTTPTRYITKYGQRTFRIPGFGFFAKMGRPMCPSVVSQFHVINGLGSWTRAHTMMLESQTTCNRIINTGRILKLFQPQISRSGAREEICAGSIRTGTNSFTLLPGCGAFSRSLIRYALQLLIVRRAGQLSFATIHSRSVTVGIKHSSS